MHKFQLIVGVTVFILLISMANANQKNIKVESNSSAANSSNIEKPDIKLPRGQMLYENHCGVCHDSRIHIRENRKVKSIEDIRYWINRWTTYLKLHWSEEEKNAVANHLGKKYYRFQASQ